MVGPGFLFASYGFWAAAAPTPSFHAPPRWARLAIRFGAAPIALVAVVVSALSTFSSISVLGMPTVYTARAAVQIAGLASLFAFSRLLEHFELSLPDPRPDLRKRVKGTRKNLAALVIIFAIGWWQTLYSTPRTPMPLGLAPILLTIGFLCFERTIRHVHKGIHAELAAARSTPHTSPLSTNTAAAPPSVTPAPPQSASSSEIAG